MSGHSKWATIRHKKGAADAKRGKIFTKIIKEIIVASKLGGGDPESNARLRTAITKARASNMPKDNIERAIKKGSGDTEGSNYFELVYEGYGPGGVAIMVESLTDNKNRTAADVRSIFTKNSGNLGESGCVSYLFAKKGVISTPKNGVNEDALIELALEAGADDIVAEDENFTVYTSPGVLESVVQTLSTKGMQIDNSEVLLIPDTTVEVDEETAEKVMRLLELLDDNDDVQEVSSNVEFPASFG